MDLSRVVPCLVAVAGAASAQLVTEVKCDQFICKTDEYCSQDTSRCSPCRDICNQTHQNHNYDAGLCVKECQGYLHDLRYMLRTESSSTTNLKNVELQAKAALIISCVALAVLLIILMMKCINLFGKHRGKFTWKYLRQKLQPSKNRVNQYPTDLTHRNPHAMELPKTPRHELKLEIRNPEPPKANQQPLNVRDLDNRTSHGTDKSHGGATTPKTVSTNISNRHPAEDTTLDYSYDNMGLNVTPPPVQASASHNF